MARLFAAEWNRDMLGPHPHSKYGPKTRDNRPDPEPQHPPRAKYGANDNEGAPNHQWSEETAPTRPREDDPDELEHMEQAKAERIKGEIACDLSPCCLSVVRTECPVSKFGVIIRAKRAMMVKMPGAVSVI